MTKMQMIKNIAQTQKHQSHGCNLAKDKKIDGSHIFNNGVFICPAFLGSKGILRTFLEKRNPKQMPSYLYSCENAMKPSTKSSKKTSGVNLLNLPRLPQPSFAVHVLTVLYSQLCQKYIFH